MNNQDLFTQDQTAFMPLAARMRPKTLESFYGQAHLLAENKPLYQAIKQGTLHSMILWGPPGSGKTTLARLLAQSANANIEFLSAVLAGVKEVRQVVDKAIEARRMYQRATILFVDEVHRFNKAQQDAFLPYVEDGTLTFIGATTENPSFALNNALLSRTRVYVLKRLAQADIEQLLQNALQDKEHGYGREKITATAQFITGLASFADGDARSALNLLEVAVELLMADVQVTELGAELLQQILGEKVRHFDNKGDYFHDAISALHKSVRGSDPDAALYWFCRMVDGGCDLAYLARRIVRLASEDIGNADPRALTLALDAWQAYERLGSPEGELALAQAVLYCACAAKSNAVYVAYNQCMADTKANGALEVPLHLRNAPTKLMKQLGYGKVYRYAHDEPHAYVVGEQYFPDQLQGKVYYQPVPRGLEQKIQEKLAWLKSLGVKEC